MGSATTITLDHSFTQKPAEIAAGSSARPTARVDSPPMPSSTHSPPRGAIEPPGDRGPAPERSLKQRLDALDRANEIRTRRAQLKRDLRASRTQIYGLLLDPPDYIQTAKVFDLCSRCRSTDG